MESQQYLLFQRHTATQLSEDDPSVVPMLTDMIQTRRQSLRELESTLVKLKETPAHRFLSLHELHKEEQNTAHDVKEWWASLSHDDRAIRRKRWQEERKVLVVATAERNYKAIKEEIKRLSEIIRFIQSPASKPKQLTKEEIQTLKARVPMSLLLPTPPLRTSDTREVYHCPFHQEKTPSFVVYKDDNHYHCFGCQESGDPITYVQKIKNLTFPQALEELQRYA